MHDTLIFLLFQIPGLAWLAWATTYAIVQTTRNAVSAEVDAKIATAVDAALARGVAEGTARVQLVVETALRGSTWTANLPAGSVVASIATPASTRLALRTDIHVIKPADPSQHFPKGPR